MANKLNNQTAQPNPAPPSPTPVSPQPIKSTSASSAQTPNHPTAAPSAQLEELTALLQRTRADFENFRKRTDEQRAQAIRLAEEGTVKKLLPLLDNLGLAIAATPALAPLQKSLEKTLKELDLEVINSETGTIFNPNEHDAISMEDKGGEREVISVSLRPGYKYRGAVIRAAMVKVTNS